MLKSSTGNLFSSQLPHQGHKLKTPDNMSAHYLIQTLRMSFSRREASYEQKPTYQTQC